MDATVEQHSMNGMVCDGLNERVYLPIFFIRHFPSARSLAIILSSFSLKSFFIFVPEILANLLPGMACPGECVYPQTFTSACREPFGIRPFPRL